MQAVSYSGFWVPRVPLNTDIVPIEKFPTPKKARLFTHEAGAELKIGDSVKTGQRLAPDLVSPVTGRIGKVEPFKGIDGEDLTSISIDVAEKDEMMAGLKAIGDPAAKQRDELASALADLGFHITCDDEIDTAVLSCLDLDPLHTINQQTFRENADQLRDALALLKALTGAKRVVFVVTRQLFNLAKKNVDSDTEIVVLKAVYPNGLPDVILMELSKTVSDLRKGFVIGTERLFAMLKALKTGKPLQDKTLTLSVPQRRLCKNLSVRIGTPIADILGNYEIELGKNGKLILGGAMRGQACYSAEFSIRPDTDSLCVQAEAEAVEYEDSPCIHCGKCSAVCPVGLRVNLICRYSEYGLFDRCRALNVDGCIECGLCAYSCTARRPLVHYIKLAKAELAQETEPEPQEVSS